MIVIADLHLGRENDSVWNFGMASQTVDVQTRLKWVLEETITRNQTAIAVAGDIFNKVNPLTRHISIFFDWLSACRSHNVSVYLIGGNHDAGVDWMNMTMLCHANLDGVFVVTSPQIFNVDDGRSCGPVLFWPHIPLGQRELIKISENKSISEYVSEQFPQASIIITHGIVDNTDYINDIFFEAGDAMSIDPRMFPSIGDSSGRIVAGHIHNQGDYGRISYPGSLTINNFGEVDERKGFIDLDVQTGDIEWNLFPDNDVRPWRHVELDLTRKDETSLDPAVIAEVAKDATLKLTVYVKKHGIVDEVAIRSMFDKYGKVTRFETKVKDSASSEAVVDSSQKSHAELLETYLDVQKGLSSDTRDHSLKIGIQIIEGVIGVK